MGGCEEESGAQQGRGCSEEAEAECCGKEEDRRGYTQKVGGCQEGGCKEDQAGCEACGASEHRVAPAIRLEYAHSGSERRTAMPDDRSSWAAQYIRQYCEKCPVCRSVWSKTVKRCSCGYDFQTQTMGPPADVGSRNWLWPEINDSESAAAAGRDGAAAAFV